MKWAFWRRTPPEHIEAKKAVEEAAAQLREVRRNEPRVQEDKAWANRVITHNHLSDLFEKSLRRGGA